MRDLVLCRQGPSVDIRGFPIFFSLVALWFSVDTKTRRSQILAGLLATCIMVALSV